MADEFNLDDSPDSGGKATLDESDIGFQSMAAPPVGKAQQKVELDLDDAPFLEDEEDEEDVEAFAEAPTAELPSIEEKSDERTHFRRFRWYYLTVALAVLLAIPIRLYIMPIFQSEAPPPPPAAPEEPLPPPEPPKPQEITLRLDPFWVEKQDEQGNVRFVHLQFAVSTTSKTLEQEFRHKNLVLRDAVYYYLRNKKFSFLSDTNNIETMKSDIVAVLNQFIGSERLETVYVEQYLIK